MNIEAFKARLEKLSPEQRKLLALQINRAQQENPEVDDAASARLVAYIIGDGTLDNEDLKTLLKDRLPDYMIPANFVSIDKFPRLPNGKINLHELPHWENNTDDSTSDFIAPRSDIEKKLAAIWSEVLNFEEIGIHDNYFEIGGDSILSIQIIAKANKIGLHLKPNALFDHQTIAQLALSVEEQAVAPKRDELIIGEIPLVPIQYWFFDQHKNAPHYWNQGLIFNKIIELSSKQMEEALNFLINHHDGLRQNYKEHQGQWQAIIRKPDKRSCFHHIDISSSHEESYAHLVNAKTTALQSQLDLANDPLFQGIYFNTATDSANQFVLFAHHLVVDAVSWGIIIEDLKSLCQQLKNNQPMSLASKSTSYKDWGLHLTKLSTSESIINEKEYWEAQIKNCRPLPKDFEVNETLTEEHNEFLEFKLDQNLTQQLSSESINAYNTKMDEYLMAVLAKVIGNWSQSSDVGFFVEKHGRESNASEIQLSNTVGWCTSFFPLTINLENKADTGHYLKSVKEQFRNVPNGGIGYGILRYLSADSEVSRNLEAKPSIIFNYLGKLAVFSNNVLGPSTEISVGTRHEQSERSHQLEINAFIKEDQLVMRWVYHTNMHKQETIQSLVHEFEETLRNFITHCSAPDAGGFTPSDFPEAGLSQDDLDNLLGDIEL